MDFTQKSFVGGLNRLVDPTRIDPNQYPFLKNGRTRYDITTPIRKPKRIVEGLPSGKIQGIYTSGSYVLVFVDGSAYYKDYGLAGTNFAQIVGFSMSGAVDTIYAELIPSTTMLGKRSLKTAGDITSGVTITGEGASVPRCVICQDGVTQPQIILLDGTARTTQNYDQWTPSAREYVPIGKQMLYYSGVLYIVSSDGFQIFRSVTGRPLDFIVAIDTNGNKLVDGGSRAENTSHKVAFDPITCIKAVSTYDGSFFVSTVNNSFMVTPLTDQLIFGEPTFRNIYLFNTGALNQFSVVDILGDNALIDYTGMKSFNAVMQLRFEGKNAPFSAKVHSLLVGIIQDNPCAVEFDNYALFSLKTIYGHCLLVYDTINSCYVGLDQFTGIAPIKYMAVVKTALTRKLLFVTTSNELYEAYSEEKGLETCGVYIGEFCSADPKTELGPQLLKLVFINAQEDGTVYVTPYVDRLKETKFSAFIAQSILQNQYPMEPPFGTAMNDTDKTLAFDLGRCRQGWKFGFYIEWDFNASLSHVAFEGNELKARNTLEQTSHERFYYSKVVPTIKSFMPSSASATQLITVFGTGFNNILACFIGGVVATSFTLFSDTLIKFPVPIGAVTGKITLKTSEYEVESATECIILP